VATIDAQRNAVVIRIVYAGPPMSGKTETIKGLATTLTGHRPDNHVYTPDEIGGRTMFFDWFDYTGGLFKGYQVRCQLVSTPGQAALAERRRTLLDTADAVIFVADADPARMPANLAALDELNNWYPNGELLNRMLCQVNKQDLPNAINPDRFSSEFPRSRIIGSSAVDKSGLRESFVTAVGIALEWVSKELLLGRVPTGPPSVDSGELLREFMVDKEKVAKKALIDAKADTQKELDPVPSPPESVAEIRQPPMVRVATASPAPAPAPVSDVPAPADVPLPNSDRVSPGCVWTPIIGRKVLEELERMENSAGVTLHGDSYLIQGKAWSGRSLYADQFDTRFAGQQALLERARKHARILNFMFPERCLCLAADGRGSWRIWQVWKTQGNLTEQLQAVIEQAGEGEIAQALLETITLFNAILPDAMKWLQRVPELSEIIEWGPQSAFSGYVDDRLLDTSQATMAEDPPITIPDGIADVLPRLRVRREIDISAVCRNLETKMQHASLAPDFRVKFLRLVLGD